MTLTLSSRGRYWLILSLTAGAFLLRVWQLGNIPPGWRDDELINTLVISQKILDGDLAVYYADASGHEALYHALNAMMLGLFGANAAGIRLLSAILGTLAVPLTYLVGRRLFNETTGWLAAAGLAVSFWSLIYSRIGLRHIMMVPLILLTIYFFWRGFTGHDRASTLAKGFVFQSSIFNYGLTAVFMALGFYTYFAGRGVPLILLAFCIVVGLFDQVRFRQHWRGWLIMFAITALLAIPLLVTLSRHPEAEARVQELAVPVIEARQGNLAPLGEFTLITLGMFHATGDGEWLYNIPDRPVFGLTGAVFFWFGLLLALSHAVRILAGIWRSAPPQPPAEMTYASGLLLLWWLAGIAPGFFSVPPASLGHTILAQPATYLLAALAVGGWQGRGLRKTPLRLREWRLDKVILLQLGLGVVLVGGIAWRDLPDYFINWPQRGMVRFLYRADIAAVADYTNGPNGLTDFGITGLLAGPWDKLALQSDLDQQTKAMPRWYNPERAILLEPRVSFSGYPNVSSPYSEWQPPFVHTKWGEIHVAGYTLTRVNRMPEMEEPICFMNGLCWVTAVYDPESHLLQLGWQVERPLILPPEAIISNPPPPGVYAGPRLLVFGQLLDENGQFLAGDDGLWVDPYTLQPGDIFLQQHRPQLSTGQPAFAAVGLYDPLNGERILTTDGRDHIRLRLPEGEVVNSP